MNLIEIKNKDKYNNFVSSQKHSQFLQSWEWGEFYKNMGFVTERKGIEKDGGLVGVITLIEKKLPLGIKYWYAPRVNFQFSIFNFQSIFNELKIQAKNNKIIFLRFDPVEKFKIENLKLKIIRTIDVQPSKTLILDINKPEEELLKDMRQKTRYNIRLAKKKGVEIKVAETYHGASGEFEEWWKIMEETCQRDGFRLHAKEYYQKMLSSCHSERSEESLDPISRSQAHSFQDDKRLKIKLIVAKYKDKIIAGNIVSFFGDMATYVHGASSNENRNVMAPFALQWRMIQEAKKQGCKYYDFYGIDEKKRPGVTRFKKGFGGEEVNYPGTFDLIFSNIWYNVYKLIRKLRRMF